MDHKSTVEVLVQFAIKTLSLKSKMIQLDEHRKGIYNAFALWKPEYKVQF